VTDLSVLRCANLTKGGSTTKPAIELVALKSMTVELRRPETESARCIVDIRNPQADAEGDARGLGSSETDWPIS